MKKKKIKRFYVMPEIWVTVTQSQVFNWVKLINEAGIPTDCISITSKKNNKEAVNKIEEHINGRFIEVHDFRKLIISDLYNTFVFLKYYLKNVFKVDKIIFQTRLGSLGFTYAVLKWLPKAKFILESRGAGNEETNHATQTENKNLKKRIQTYFSVTSEKLLLVKSDAVFCVSNALSKYYRDKYNLNAEKFKVFPGAADSESFFYDLDLRKNSREELKLTEDDILIVYSGRLEMKWEIPDKIFEFFENSHTKNNRFKLLLLTPDVDLAINFIKEKSLENITIVKSVKFDEVNKYLNASDVGLLLREDIPMNNVASPTKFAEYLMTGLPVIISSGIFDFADMINQTKYGSVVKGLEEMTSSEYEKLETSLQVDRNEIAIWGEQNLSKRVFIDKYVKLLKEV